MSVGDNSQTDRVLYSISQVNALTGVSTPTIRKWETAFRDYLAVVRTSGGQRRFNQDAVDKIEMLKRLIYEEGLSLEGARKRLDTSDEVDAPEVPVDDTFDKLSEMVTDLLLRKLFREGIDPAASGLDVDRLPRGDG